MPSPAPKREDLGPGKVHPTRQGGQALNPEPLPHAQSMSQAPSESASQAPTCLHHFLLGGLPQGTDVQAGTVGLRLPPLTLPLPHQSQTCHLSGQHPPPLQGHFTKATMPNESVLPSSLSSGPRTACGLPEQALRALHRWAPAPLKSKLYHSLGLQQEELLISHLQALVQAPPPHRELSHPFRDVTYRYLQEVLPGLFPPRP